MKAEVKDTLNDKKFKPITLEIIIESEKELCSLWLRLNFDASLVNKTNSNSIHSVKHPCESGDSLTLWGVLDNLCESRNLLTTKI